MVAIEILSPDDRYSAVLEKLQEYRDWGVPHSWVVDPVRRALQVYADSSVTEVASLSIPEYGVQLTGAEIFG